MRKLINPRKNAVRNALAVVAVGVLSASPAFAALDTAAITASGADVAAAGTAIIGVIAVMFGIRRVSSLLGR